jgi:hypothetical protein
MEPIADCVEPIADCVEPIADCVELIVAVEPIADWLHVEPIDCVWSMVGWIAAWYTYNSLLGWPIATHHYLLLSSLIK